MSSPLQSLARVLLMSAALAIPSIAMAQQQLEDVDPEVRVQQLESQLRQLTGQNEELQFRNRQLEDQLRQSQAAAPPAGRPNVAAAPPGPAPRQNVQPVPVQPQVYDQQAAPAPIVQDPAPPRGGRRNDAFDPSANPGAPGVPRALGGGQLPLAANAPVGRAGEPIDLNNAAPRAAAAPLPREAGATGGLTTLPPGATPKDEFDLGIGYMQRRDYALAEETMRNFAQKYPTDPQIADSQYWLGESFYQRQKYRDAAEAFLGVTTKFGTSAKAPDALLRLGKSLAALKEKEAACAAFGEVLRKYPKASNGVKTAVDREQKRVKC
ncbi:tol-pal system protein YbgF [Tardiphaga sp.]|uniref:tol-pal system protein YbgF n=1 Tax=Tardiphaga sp. TaxID=1926292 RepID=UPI0025FC52E2|nr:tol-pal system protein YbgF [Tardiphaga sp.]